MVEQLIPMMGLEDLAHSMNPPPQTTPEKVLFLIENAVAHGKRLTTIISFSSLFILIIFRFLKRRIMAIGPRWKWVTYIPEIFILVVVSTSESVSRDCS